MMKNRTEELLRKLLSGTIDNGEKDELLHTEHMERYLREQWEQSARRDEPSDFAGARIWKKVSRACLPRPRRRLLHPYAWVAAASVLLVVGVGLLLRFGAGQAAGEEYVTVRAEEGRRYDLPDGTRVYMQKGSSLSYTGSFATDRVVRLKGRSLFEVRKHGDTPFRVYISDDAFVEVKGTTFWVSQRDSGAQEVTLFEGRVDFNIESAGRSIAMNPSEKILYRPAEAHAVTLVKINGVTWSDGKYRFSEIPLQQLLDNIAHLYAVTIEVDEGVDVRSTFSGSIRHDESLTDVIEKICFSLGIRYREKNGIIRISQ